MDPDTVVVKIYRFILPDNLIPAALLALMEEFEYWKVCPATVSPEVRFPLNDASSGVR
jgi:hypothetical protein